MARYIYETEFNLTNPVNDFREARAYLSEDDMTKYLVDDLKGYRNRTGIDADCIEKIEWDLLTEDEGIIRLITTAELTKEQLAEISDWVSGQNSDGLGEGFEQQEFAETCEEDEYGDIDWDTCVMSSFDWNTNKYIFTLMRKEGVNESSINEAEKPENNILVRKVQIFPDMDDDDWALEKTTAWLKEIGKDAIGWISTFLKSFPKEGLIKVKFVVTQPDEFACKVYTDVNLFDIDKRQREDLIDAVDSMLKEMVQPMYQSHDFGKVEKLRTFHVLSSRTAMVSEAKDLKNSVVVCHFEITPEMTSEYSADWEKTAKWLTSLVIRKESIEKEIGDFAKGLIKKVEFVMDDPEYSEFDCRVYTNKDINTLSGSQILAIQRGIEYFVLYQVGKEYEQKPFSKIQKSRMFTAHSLKARLENESKCRKSNCDKTKKVNDEEELLNEVDDSMEQKLLALETDDYQDRQGDYPESGEPDVIQVYKAGGTYNVEASFKNTPESLAEYWLKNYLEGKGFKVEKVDARQDGDYQDDWVLATAVIDRSIITESADSDPTQANPLKIAAPRGEYWVWVEGSEIYGSAVKPNPDRFIVNARSYTNFSAQGFDTVDEVVEYVKKYF